MYWYFVQFNLQNADMNHAEGHVGYCKGRIELSWGGVGFSFEVELGCSRLSVDDARISQKYWANFVE